MTAEKPGHAGDHDVHIVSGIIAQLRRCWTIRTRASVVTVVFLMSVSLNAADTIPGWGSYSDDGFVQASLDPSAPVNGKPSVHLKVTSKEPSARVAFFQSVKADSYLGRVVKIVAIVKTVDFRGQLSLAAVTYDGSPYFYFYSQQIKNPGQARQWQKLDLTFVVPAKTSLVNFGLYFKGAEGSAWLAGVEFGTSNSCEPQCKSGVKSGRLTRSEQDRAQNELRESRDHPQNLDFSGR